MSDYTDDCLLNDILSLESNDVHADKEDGLLFSSQTDKFGVSNDEALNNTDKEYTASFSPQSSSFSSSLTTSYTKISVKSNKLSSSSSEVKDTSDSEVQGRTYMALCNEQDKQFSSSETSSQIEETPYVQQQTSQSWIKFDDGQVNASSNIDKPSYAFLAHTNQQVPAIPSRRMSNNTNKIDLLTMDSDCLNTPLEQTNKEVPPIPDRVLSPKKIPSNTSSPCQSPSPASFDFRLPPPASRGSSMRRQSRGRSSVNNPSTVGTKDKVIFPVTPTSVKGPPVPPRKDLLGDQPLKTKLDILATASSSDSSRITKEPSGPTWIQFEETVKGVNSCQSPSAFENDLIGAGFDSQINDGSKSFDDCVFEEGKIEVMKQDEGGWPTITPTPTSSQGSPKSLRKKKGGYQHLPSDSDEEKSNVSENATVKIKVTDLSPMKPLSRWAPIQNEVDDVAGSSGNVSAHNSLGDELVSEDLGLDDDFGLNRLSTEINGLRGFNRADKGSQNNLVDFSGSDGKNQGSVRSSVCSSAEDEDLETIFDMTAKGDSLKRKRHKKIQENIPGTSQNEPAKPENIKANTNETKEEENLNLNPQTNPFWTASPIGDTSSLASSTGEGNPFERIQFQSVSSAPAAKQLFPTIPPPPSTGKVRSTSGSYRRRREVSASSPFQPSNVESDDLSEVNERKIVNTPEASTLLNTSVKNEDTISTLSNSVDPIVVPTAAHSSTPVSMLDDISCTGISTKKEESSEKNILNTTLSLLDISLQPKDDSLINAPDVDVLTCSAMQLDPVFPASILHDKSMESLEKLQKAISVESPDSTDVVETKKSFASVKIIPRLTEWSMLMRFPRQKRVMSTRRWVPIYVRLNISKPERPSLQLFHTKTSKDPFYVVSLSQHDWQMTEPTLQARFSSSDDLSDVDAMLAAKRKVHSVKLLHVRYKEKVAFSTKQDKILMKPPVGFKHSLRWKQAIKIGTEKYSDLCSFIASIKDAAFNANRLPGFVKKEVADPEHSPVVKYHSRDEIVFDCKDEFKGFVTSSGEIKACEVTVNVFVTSFLSGDPMATVTFNDAEVEGREVVRREDIMPSSNSQWVEIHDVAVHRCSAPHGYDKQNASLTFYPPDACRFQLSKFHCPYRESNLPITVKVTAHVKSNHVSLRCILRSSGTHSSNKDPLAQVPCEDLNIRFFVPPSWVPAFRRSGRFRIKSVHAKRIIKRSSAARSTFAHMEATIGSAKYEAAHGAVVWRVARFPGKNAAQNTPQVFSCALDLASDLDLPRRDVIGDDVMNTFTQCEVEYTMPSATASGTCVRSIHLPNTNKAEKFTCYSARYFYKVDMTVTHYHDTNTSETTDCTVQ
nr:uncharacterized protein LOC100183638 [Ciona intestinalis]|eukprot:XP_002122692.2 uncharacterized protein LOC100183638 [Ciona intestinalis]